MHKKLPLVRKKLFRTGNCAILNRKNGSILPEKRETEGERHNTMIRLALVEDDGNYRSQLKEYIARYAQSSGERFTVQEFEDGDEIALGYKAEYDIILMDIEMKFMDGMMAAGEIRKVDTEVIIIFITNSPQYAIMGYAVDALDYVIKPVSYFAFSQRLARAIERLQHRSRHFLQVNTREGTHKLDIKQLYYIESQGHDLFFHTSEGELLGSGSMQEFEKRLEAYSFFRCNKGYLVNLEYVDTVHGENVIVHGETVALSRARRKAFLDALNNYINGV